MKEGFTLYSVSSELTELLENVMNPETGEIDADIEKQIEGLEIDRTEKIHSCIRWIKSQRAYAAALKAEADQMAKRQKVFANAADSCEKYLESLVDSVKDKGVGCDAGVLAWTKSTKVIVDDETKLPAGSYILERKPVKAKIKEGLKAEEATMKLLDDEGKEAFVSKFEGAAHFQITNSFKIK